MTKFKNEVATLNAIVNDVLANGIKSEYVDNLSGITKATNILNEFCNLNVRVMYEISSTGKNLVHIQLMDNEYGYCSEIIDNNSIIKIDDWYGIIRGLHFMCDVHYNFPDLEQYIGRVPYLQANENLELTKIGEDFLNLTIKEALNQYASAVKYRYSIK